MRTTVPTARPFADARAVLLGATVFVAAAPLLATVEQSALLVAAAGLGVFSEYVTSAILPLLPVDPVYGGAALHILGGIQPRGLAVAGPIGDVLHTTWPSAFLAPALVADGALVSAVLESGATVMARMLAVLVVAIALLGVSIVAAHHRRSPSWLKFASLIVQAVLLGELMLQGGLSLRELEATGLPFILAALGPVGEAGQRALWTRQFDGVPDATIRLAWGSLLAVTAYLVALGLIVLVRLIGRVVHVADAICRPGWERPANGSKESNDDAPTARPREERHVVVGRQDWDSLEAVGGLTLRGAAAALLAVIVLMTPLGAIVEGRPSYSSSAVGAVEDSSEAATWESSSQAAAPPEEAVAEAAAPVVETGVPTAAPTDEPAAVVAKPTAQPAGTVAPVTASPSAVADARPSRSHVTIEGHGYRFVYRVNGKPTVIRGMGYNPWYANLDPAERRQRYDRDFGLMRRIGVNTIEGWFENQFDTLTLDVAHQHRLGVIMPFELNQDYDYADPSVRAMFIDQVSAWVLRYKDHPAVRMWGPGNENMHRLIFPTMVAGQRDPAREARADAFAAFYVELIDVVHALDPYHPVVYRDAEDLYFDRIRDALLRDGKPRPWFIYGTNAYTPRLQQVIEDWPTKGLDAPLLVSEFSPGGVAPVDRPEKLAWFWSIIRGRPEMVLGGVVYTWATEGPEDLDRIFGLTDIQGRPVDGSISALSRLFNGRDIVDSATRDPVPAQPDERAPAAAGSRGL